MIPSPTQEYEKLFPNLFPLAPVVPTGTIDEVLKERGKRYDKYGDYPRKAGFIQDFKYAMRESPAWEPCTDAQKESLDMIAHKIGRILCGEPDHADSWRDIAGYAMLIANTLKD